MRIAVSPVSRVSAVWQVVLLFLQEYSPKPDPQSYATVFVVLFGVIPLVATLLPKPVALYPAAWNSSWARTGMALVALGVVPPVAGLVEARLASDPQVYETSRFTDHLINNVCGAVAVAALLWVGKKVRGFGAFSAGFTDKEALNCVLPMAMLTAFAFVRWQQASATVPAIYSLQHVNQWTNLFFLVVVMFTATTTVLYLFAFAIRKAKDGQPLDFSWQIAVAMVFSLVFFYVCGLVEWTPSLRAVYLTFLTGTPAALVAVLVWLSLLKPSTARNWFAITLGTLGYVLYTVEAVLASRSGGEGLQLYYFAPGAFALALAGLAGALYRSP